MTLETTVFITLGSGNEFGLSDHNMFIRHTQGAYYEDPMTIDLGPATKENLNRLIEHMRRLECHFLLKDE